MNTLAICENSQENACLFFNKVAGCKRRGVLF